MGSEGEQEPDMMDHAYNLCTREAEGYPKTWGQPEGHRELEVNLCYRVKPLSQETQSEKC